MGKIKNIAIEIVENDGRFDHSILTEEERKEIKEEYVSFMVFDRIVGELSNE
jgi:hypothetical protein